jgi:hypothetical protein
MAFYDPKNMPPAFGPSLMGEIMPDLRKRLDEAIEQASASCDQAIRERAMPVPTFAGIPIPPMGHLSAKGPAVIHIDGFKQFHEQRETARTTRAENRRIGEELAKGPPPWAYPLAWRLAVMAVVEDYNCRDTPRTFQQAWEDADATNALRAYHLARINGQTEKSAMAEVRKIAGLIGSTLAIACHAYERGRPGPGGVRLGRPCS